MIKSKTDIVKLQPIEAKLELVTAQVIKWQPKYDLEVFVCTVDGKVRSVDYNAYYWGVLLKIISEHTGHTTADLHEYYSMRFLPKFTVVFGELLQGTTGTRNLRHKEFDEYVQMVRIHAEQIGAGYIPLPNETPNYVYVEQVNQGLIG